MVTILARDRREPIAPCRRAAFPPSLGGPGAASGFTTAEPTRTPPVMTTSLADSLAIAIVPTAPIYTDYGSGASLNVAIYRPVSIPDGWYYLGDLAVSLPSSVPYTSPAVANIAPYAVIVQPLDGNAICPVNTASEALWTDQHSDGAQDIEIWAPQPAKQGYTALGLFAWVDEGYDGSPAGSFWWNKLAAINSAFIKPGEFGRMIWSDQNSGAKGSGQWGDIALWSIATSQLGLIPTNTFVAASDYSSPPVGLVPAPSILPTL